MQLKPNKKRFSKFYLLMAIWNAFLKTMPLLICKWIKGGIMQAVYVGCTLSLEVKVWWLIVLSRVCKSDVAPGHLLHAGGPVPVSQAPAAGGESSPEGLMGKSKLDFWLSFSS